VARHFWARGYFVSTAGRNETVIREYVKNQEKEEKEDERGLWQPFGVALASAASGLVFVKETRGVDLEAAEHEEPEPQVKTT
jgi:Transposase IS200 like